MNFSNERSNQEIMLSVCVVSYNHAQYIRECLEHILTQEMNFSYEIMVGNDCSTDRTAEVLEEYGDRVRIINRTDNLGLCANLYDLLLQARGKYVFPFSGDDYLCDERALQKQVDFLESHPEYYAVSAWNYLYKESDGKMYGSHDEGEPTEFTMEDFLRDGFLPTTHGMLRNTFAQDREENQYLIQGCRNNEEMKMWLYTLSKGKRYIIHEYLHVYRNVDQENKFNYNSTHTLVDMFKDNYDDLCILRELFKGKYNLKPLILRRSNYYCIRLSDSTKNLASFVKIMRFSDAAALFLYKCYLILHKHKDPLKWQDRDYLIPGRT